MSYVVLGATQKDPAEGFYRWVDQNRPWLEPLSKLEPALGAINPVIGVVEPIGSMLDFADRRKAGKSTDVGLAFRQRMARDSDVLATEAVVFQAVSLVLDASGLLTAGMGTVIGLILQIAPPLCSTLAKLCRNLALGRDVTEELFTLATLVGPIMTGMKIPGVSKGTTSAAQELARQLKGNKALMDTVRKKTPKKAKEPPKSMKVPDTEAPEQATKHVDKKNGTVTLLLAGAGAVAAVAGAPIWVPAGAAVLAVLSLRK